MVEAYECFLNQTYLNKQLVIVNNGNKEYFESVNELVQNNPDVTHIHVMKTNLGMYRNEGLKHSRGEYVCTWDDDDIHRDDFLETMYNSLKLHNVDAVLLMDFTEQKIENSVVSTSTTRMTMGLDGTVVFRHPGDVASYLPINKGEDTKFLSDLSSKLHYRILVRKNDPGLYTYRFHGSNITVQ